MNINNSNPNIGYKNIKITIKNFHIHNEFHNHENTNKNLDHNWTKVIRNNIEHHLLINSPKKRKKEKENHPLIKTPKENIFALASK